MIMIDRYNPDSMAPPFSSYSQGVEVPAGARTIYVEYQALPIQTARINRSSDLVNHHGTVLFTNEASKQSFDYTHCS